MSIEQLFEVAILKVVDGVLVERGLPVLLTRMQIDRLVANGSAVKSAKVERTGARS